MSLFQELKRRNVIRVGILYIVAAWVILQITDVGVSILELPSWTGKLVFLLVMLGFIPALLASWLYELTPEGLKRDHEVDHTQSITGKTGRKIDTLIAVFGLLAVSTIVLDRIVPQRATVVAPESSVSAKFGQQSATPAPDQKSVAVLAFVNMSDDEGQEFFSDGISEELLNVLAQIEGLRVAARTSSFQFKGANHDISEIANTLGVAHVLEGSVRKAGDRVRITAQLINAADGFHMWSETFDRELDDIFAIQDEIAGAVADQLQIHLGLSESNKDVADTQRPQIIEAANPAAYEAYLHGRQLINRRGKNNLEEAVGHLERSLRLDSEFAPAHAQLAIAITMLLSSSSTYGDLSLAEVVKRAGPHVERALALAPRLAESHAAQSLLLRMQGHYEEAIEFAETAVSINPSYVDAQNWRVNAMGPLGRHSDLVAGHAEIYRIDPRSVIGRVNYANTMMETGRKNEVSALTQELISEVPWAGHFILTRVLITVDGDIASGLRHGLQAHALEPTNQLGNSLIVSAFGWLELLTEARRVSDSVAFDAAYASRDYTVAAEIARHELEEDSENLELVLKLAAALSREGGHDIEVMTLYEQSLKKQAPRPWLFDYIYVSAMPMARVASLWQATGEVAGASEMIDHIEADLRERERAGFNTGYDYVVSAMLAAMQGDSPAAATFLDNAVDRGWREPGVFDEPLFAPFVDSNEFRTVAARLESILAAERAKTLKLICDDNPIPNAWMPSPTTCAML
ncbi:MAG: hypothetical protein KJP16_05055 [Gammaproteobacteria bacterium]|nr:hypothetical protein [Gammaproteobacteria bacterium]NNL50166.1 hypothetical protein [Woeseiaceae bacterium]